MKEAFSLRSYLSRSGAVPNQACRRVLRDRVHRNRQVAQDRRHNHRDAPLPRHSRLGVGRRNRRPAPGTRRDAERHSRRPAPGTRRDAERHSRRPAPGTRRDAGHRSRRFVPDSLRNAHRQGLHFRLDHRIYRMKDSENRRIRRVSGSKATLPDHRSYRSRFPEEREELCRRKQAWAPPACPRQRAIQLRDAAPERGAPRRRALRNEGYRSCELQARAPKDDR